MAAPSDPLFASQWHLNNASGVDLNVLPVWDPGSGAAYTGAGVSVLIFDDAVEIDPLRVRFRDEMVWMNSEAVWLFDPLL